MIGNNKIINEPEEKGHWEKYKFYYLIFGTFFLSLLIFMLSSNSINNDVKKINSKLGKLLDGWNDSDDLSEILSKINKKKGSKFIFPQAKDKDENWLEAKVFQKDIRKKIKEKINFFKNIERYLTSKAGYINKNILFYGPPGTGKSFYAELLAKNESSAYRIIPAGELQQIYVGSGSLKQRDFFEEAKKIAKKLPHGSKPVMLIIEEFDSLGGQGKSKPDDAKDDTLVNTFLTIMDEIHGQRLNINVLATTNYLTMLEEAAIRPGRFSHKIEINFPHSQAEYEDIFDSLKKNIEEELKNKKNQPFWLEKSEDNIIEFSPDFWIGCKQKLWETVSRDDDFLEKSGFSILHLKSLIDSLIASKIDDNSRDIHIDNNDLPKFTEKLEEEVAVKKKEIERNDLLEQWLNRFKNPMPDKD